jgi:predicted amidohydrolase
MGKRLLKIGIVQPRPVSRSFAEFQAGGDIRHACDLLTRLPEADLVCFPEYYPCTGEAELARQARELGIGIIAGLIERTPKGVYNTVTVFDSSGAILGRQRKHHLTRTEVERDGIVPGRSYRIFELGGARIGIVICADFPFFTDWQVLIRNKADIILNPSRWFALAEAFPATIISRHLQFGVPIIGLNWARFSFPEWRSTKNGFPPAGGQSTITHPPAVANLNELAEWFRTKPSGIDSIKEFVTVLGKKEQTALVTIDLDAVRRFSGYYFSERQRAT